MDDETAEIVLARMNHADGDDLIRAANGMDTAYERFWNVRGRIAGVRTDLVDQWDSDSGRTMLDYLETVEQALAEVGGALTIMADKLRAHGKVINTARDTVRDLVIQGYQDPLSVTDSDLDAPLQDFLDSERALTTDLWTYGALAPGGIPLPEPPPRPPGDWKTFIFGDGYPAGWYWLGADGKYPDLDDYDFGDDYDPGTYDPDNPLYGYDEWGQPGAGVPGSDAGAGGDPGGRRRERAAQAPRQGGQGREGQPQRRPRHRGERRRPRGAGPRQLRVAPRPHRPPHPRVVPARQGRSGAAVDARRVPRDGRPVRHPPGQGVPVEPPRRGRDAADVFRAALPERPVAGLAVLRQRLPGR
ncbi:hypothetical protein [Nocardioides sp. TF02-7]|uniref:hypothetical protein n=1 Tax=Nocardioides sp. TF02-7 TaxID=2917724 RepID=UPI001F06F54C|nr:hypothetical protein [Nocardioides sp. TF02-7]UMG94226.1 hypothetical protein MF408_09510 [Nocardioides sp. TF02-7]